MPSVRRRAGSLVLLRSDVAFEFFESRAGVTLALPLTVPRLAPEGEPCRTDGLDRWALVSRLRRADQWHREEKRRRARPGEKVKEIRRAPPCEENGE